MDKLLFILIFYLPYFQFAQTIQFSNDCSQDASKTEKIMLKVIYVVDHTESFNSVTYPLWEMIEVFEKEAKSLYQNIEWAGAYFFDYSVEAQPDLGEDETKPHKMKNCYSRFVSFTNESVHRIFSTLRRPIQNGGKENSLHALAQAVVDKEMLWEANTEGKTVKKLAILMTDRGYGNISNPGDRHEYIGDGSDQCWTSKPPTIEKVGEILKKNDVAVIGMLPFGTFEPDVLQTYEQYFQQMPGVPFCGRTFNMKTETNTETVVSSLMSCFKQVC